MPTLFPCVHLSYVAFTGEYTLEICLLHLTWIDRASNEGSAQHASKRTGKMFTVLSRTADSGPAIVLVAVGQILTLCLGPMEEVERGAS